MPPKPVSPAVASLVHHVELNKAGWWDRTVQQVLLGRLRESGAPMSFDELKADVEAAIGRKLDAEFFDKILRELMLLGHVTELPGLGLRLSEAAVRQFDSAASDIDDNVRAVEQAFRSSLEASGLSIDSAPVWRAFRDNALVPMIADLGARTYELLSGAGSAGDPSDYLARFLEGFPEEAHARLTDVAITVLDPKSAAVRQFILRELNTRFVLEAAGLRREVLEKLGGSSGKRIQTLLFLDTNFLFSLLELHANPANEAAKLLLELLQQVRDFLDITLYVLPTTLDEARIRLGIEIDRLRGLVLTPHVAQSVHNGDLSGLAQRYVQEIARGRVRISPADFFGPYHDDLLKFARARGIELYNENMERVYREQSVIDDTLDRSTFEQEKYKERAKSYEQILHDVALRHMAASKRPRRVESPLEAGAWVVTVDYRFLGFDRHKTNQTLGQVAVCIHPAVLTQLLQFWVPRSPEFDAALVASMRLPFFFSTFDPEAERVTVQILRTLGRFENVDQLPEATIASVLASQALRQRMKGSLSVEESIRAVESAILTENVRVQAIAERERERRKQAEGLVAVSEQSLAEKDLELARLAAQAAERDSQLLAMRTQIEVQREAERNSGLAKGFAVRVALPLLLGALVLSLGAAAVFAHWRGLAIWKAMLATGVAALLISTAYLQSRNEWDVASGEWPPLRSVPSARKLLVAGILSLAGYVSLALVGDPVVEFVRSLFAQSAP